MRKTSLLADMYKEQGNVDLHPILRLAFQCIYKEQGGKKKCTYEKEPCNMNSLINSLKLLSRLKSVENKRANWESIDFDYAYLNATAGYYNSIMTSEVTELVKNNKHLYELSEQIRVIIAYTYLDYDIAYEMICDCAYIFYSLDTTDTRELGEVLGYKCNGYAKGQILELCYEIMSVYDNYRLKPE